MRNGFYKQLIIIAFLYGMLTPQAYSYDNFQSGKDAFYRKNYHKAYSDLKAALKKDPNNVNCRYYLSQTLIHTGNFTEAKNEYVRIIKISPLSKAAEFSRLGLAKIKKYELSLKEKKNYDSINSGFGDNYIKNALVKGQVIRWDKSKMPLKVYVDKAGNSHLPIVKSAFKEWISKVGKPFAYIIVNNPKFADINILFIDSLLSKTNTEKTYHYIAGLTTPKITDNYLESVQIKLATIKPNSVKRSEIELYNTTIHEIGHSLGIYGHSDKKTDIMFPVENNLKKRKLSQRDINTIKMLYYLDSDVSNTEITKENSVKNSILLGNKNQRLKSKLQEAKDYVKLVPDQPISWTTLAKEYKNMKKYSKAVANYKNAIKLDPSYIPAREGLAAAYFLSKRYSKAVAEYKSLVRTEPSNVDYSHSLALTYLKLNNTQRANNVINKLIIKNPDSQKDEKIKGLIQLIHQSNNQ